MATRVRELEPTTIFRKAVHPAGQQSEQYPASTPHGEIEENGHAPAFLRCPESPSMDGPVVVEAHDKLWEPAVYEFGPFNPDVDAKELRKAMKGMGTDEMAIINLLTKRTNRQRQIIAKHYRKIYDRHLMEDLKSELSGTLEDVALSLMLLPAVLDARTIKKAIAGFWPDEQTLIEVIGSRTPEELVVIKQAYQAEFKTDLEKDIAGDLPGFFRKLLSARLYNSDRLAEQEKNYEIYPKQTFYEAQALWEMGPKKWHTDEAFVIPLFTERSEEHMRQMFQDYKLFGRIDIEKDIEKELSGDAASLFLALVQKSENPPAYFADRLHTHLDTKTASRIIVSRSEKDLGSIKKEYFKRHGQTLESAVAHFFN